MRVALAVAAALLVGGALVLVALAIDDRVPAYDEDPLDALIGIG